MTCDVLVCLILLGILFVQLIVTGYFAIKFLKELKDESR